MARRQPEVSTPSLLRPSNTQMQRPPQPDNRYRVHRSVKCYLAELACGISSCTWYFSDSIQRVVYIFPGRVEKVQYKNSFYALQSPDRMKELVAKQLADGGSVHIGGKAVSSFEHDQSFVAYPFIDVSSGEDSEKYQRFQRLGGK